MPSVRTVLGDLDPISLGITYLHEHTISQPPRRFAGWDPDLVLDDVDATTRELEAFRSVGGTCLVDGSTVDYGRDVSKTAEASRRSGCPIVVTAGYNKAAYFGPDIEAATVEQLRERLLLEANEGIDGTGIRAGILKFGTSRFHMTPAEERAARAVCQVQRRTGLPLYTHTEAGTFALEQIDLLVEEGVDPAVVCIGHLDRNPDPSYLLEIARRGVYVGIDQVGKVKYTTDSVRMDLIATLVRAGYRRRILVSSDMARRSYLTAYGGQPGLRHVAASFAPLLVDWLRNDGLAPDDAERLREELLIENPREFLTMKP